MAKTQNGREIGEGDRERKPSKFGPEGRDVGGMARRLMVSSIM